MAHRWRVASTPPTLPALSFLFFCVLASLCATSSACGVTLHNAIAHRALAYSGGSGTGADTAVTDAFLAMLQAQQTAFQPGAAFPDWGYSCGFPNESEAAHWPPFALAMAQYIVEQCGAFNVSSPLGNGGWNDQCQKLGAFLFGIVSHQVADVLWHNLEEVSPSRQGFIQALATIEFDNSYSSAHTVADTGGEFVVAKELDLSFILRDWYVPADDLTNIYHQMGFTNVTSKRLADCNELLYVEVHAVKDGGEALFEWISKRSTFVPDELLTYFMGGLDDNALWTSWCWLDYLIQWLLPNDGTYAPLCLVQQEYTVVVPSASIAHSRSHFSAVPQRVLTRLIDAGYSQRQQASDGTVVFTSKPDEVFGRQHAPAAPRAKTCLPPTGSSTATSVTFNLNASYAYLGSSISSGDLNQDGIEDLVIGAPGFGPGGLGQQGAVFVVLGSAAISGANQIQLPIPGGNGTSSAATSASLPISSLVYGEAHDRFGFSTAVVDFNADGIPDLAVSSPTTAAANLTYFGQVYVFFGSGSGSFAPIPNVTISTKSNYTNLGYQLLGADCNGDGFADLLIGSPFYGQDAEPQVSQRGLLSLFYSSSQRALNRSLAVEQADWSMVGEAAGAWLGYAMLVVQRSASPQSLLLVGSPRFQSKSEVALGKLYALDLQCIAAGKGTSSCLVFSIVGASKFDQVGSAFSFGSFEQVSDMLALSLPNHDKTGFGLGQQEGIVALLDMSTLSGNVSYAQLKPKSVLNGDENWARFGWAVQLVDLAGNGSFTLWAGQPRQKLSALEGEAGAVYQWNSNVKIGGSSSVSSASACFQDEDAKSRFGEVLGFADFNGDGTKDAIMVAPRFGSLMSGTVTVLFS